MIQEPFPFHVIEGGRGGGPRLPDELAPEIPAFTRIGHGVWTRVVAAMPRRQKASWGFVYLWVMREAIGRDRTCCHANWPSLSEATGLSKNTCKKAIDWLEKRGAVAWERYPERQEIGVLRVNVPDDDKGWLAPRRRLGSAGNPVDKPVDGDGVSGGVHPSRGDASRGDASRSSSVMHHAVTVPIRKKESKNKETRARTRDDEPCSRGSSRAARGEDAREVPDPGPPLVEQVRARLGRFDPGAVAEAVALARERLAAESGVEWPADAAPVLLAAAAFLESSPCPGEVPGSSGDRLSPDGVGKAFDARTVPRGEADPHPASTPTSPEIGRGEDIVRSDPASDEERAES